VGNGPETAAVDPADLAGEPRLTKGGAETARSPFAGAQAGGENTWLHWAFMLEDRDQTIDLGPTKSGHALG
jgi:hypothetical protein